MTTPALDPATVRRAPKVLLHDHLDGGLRPATVVELADAVGHRLPAPPEELADWFHRGAASGDLVHYLATFEHTVAVLQTADALERVARECVEDLAADGVVYAEIRFAPHLHLAGGLAPDDVVEAVQSGFATAADAGVMVRTIVAAMRDTDRAMAMARLAERWRDRGVVAFDLVGPETGHPATEHLAAIRAARDAGLHVTIHAGESAGVDAIAAALDPCGAERLGHGVRIVDDLAERDGETVLGAVARRVRDGGIPLELCPTSNVHTGVVATVADHPIDRLRRLGFRVTVNSWT
jgi:adenosine deaminase